jgi:hypothetical protein
MMRAVVEVDRRPFRGPFIAALLMVAVVVGLATARPANAGEYTINVCQADEAGYASGAFADFATRGMRWRRACNPLGPGLRGLVTANVPGTGRVADGAQSAFILDAPSGTSFSRLRWSGHAQRRDCRYALQVYAERPGASPVAIKNIRANRNCPRPDLAQASSWPRPRAYGLSGATRIVQRVVCVGEPSHDFCSARGQNYIRTFAAEATVVDEIGPSAGIVQDNPFTRGEWVSGIQNFTYEASDNVGVRSAQPVLGGASREVDTRACNYSQRIPCPNGPGGLKVNTRQTAEGPQLLTVSAEDAAGNVAVSPPVTVRVDNTAPGVVPVGVVGGEAWRSSNDFDVDWTNPTEADRAPISVAHYRICRSGSGECVGGERGGEGISAVENLAVPSPGEWELRLWRQDAASNQEADNSSLPVRLRFDPEPPQLGFEGGSAEDPTRVSVLVTDPISGLGGGGIEMSRVGSGVWQVLPTSQEGERLATRIDDAAQPPGEYELRATAHDQANNLASTDRRLDGQPMRVTLPLRVATAMKAGVVGKRTVTRTVRHHGKKRKVRRTITVLEQRSKVAFGQQVRLAGRLVNRAGHPLADAKLVVYSRVADGNEGMDGSVITNADGRFVYPVEARSSRTFRFVYPGTATILPVEDTATLLVTARSSISVKPKHVLNGDSVVFKGRVKGRPLPEAGKLIELQVLLSEKWQTFRTLRTEPDGSWSIHYLFDRTCGVQHFPFRVHVTGESPFPLEPGNSPSLTVRVRGRPCPAG